MTRLETTPRHRSYAFLVERLLPRERLSASRSSRLQNALAVGDPAGLYEESLAALRDLEVLGVVTQNPTSRPGHLVFQVRNGDRIHLQDPGASQQASRPAFESIGTLAHPRAEPQARPDAAMSISDAPAAQGETATSREALVPADAAAETPGRVQPKPQGNSQQEDGAITWSDAEGSDVPTQLIDSLQPFLPLAGLEAELTSQPAQLYRVVRQIESHWPGARVQLLCLAETADEIFDDGGIRTVSRREIEAVPHHAEALRKNDVSMATRAAPGQPLTAAPVAAAVPLHVDGNVWGLLEVTWPSVSERSMQRQVLLLQPLARLIEVAIQNQNTMENLVFLDPLTGVYNRGFYERQVALEIERAHRTSRKFGLLVLDVDDFKRINDELGHRAGDQVLAQIARELQNKMRKIDLLFRYGGEEFVVLLPGAEQDETERTGERLRRIVDEMTFDGDALPADLRVTISVGAAIFPDHSRTQSGIFKAADEAMYRAKRQGKNRVALSEV